LLKTPTAELFLLGIMFLMVCGEKKRGIVCLTVRSRAGNTSINQSI
jgi:hypothetical protein